MNIKLSPLKALSFLMMVVALIVGSYLAALGIVPNGWQIFVLLGWFVFGGICYLWINDEQRLRGLR